MKKISVIVRTKRNDEELIEPVRLSSHQLLDWQENQESFLPSDTNEKFDMIEWHDGIYKLPYDVESYLKLAFGDEGKTGKTNWRISLMRGDSEIIEI